MMSAQSSLPYNVVFFAHMRMLNAAYFYSITSNSISGLNSWEDIRFGVSYGVAVKVWSRQQFFQVIYDTPFYITRLPFVCFLHRFCPFCIVFEVFHYKADTCANNSALSLIVMCLRPHSPPSSQNSLHFELWTCCSSRLGLFPLFWGISFKNSFPNHEKTGCDTAHSV